MQNRGCFTNQSFFNDNSLLFSLNDKYYSRLSDISFIFFSVVRLRQFSICYIVSWQDLNTIKKKGELAIDTNNNNYRITAGDSSKNSSVQVLHITRKLDTGDPQDVPITVSHFTACIIFVPTVVGLKKYPVIMYFFLPVLTFIELSYIIPKIMMNLLENTCLQRNISTL